jgi:hypothetical protein
VHSRSADYSGRQSSTSGSAATNENQKLVRDGTGARRDPFMGPDTARPASFHRLWVSRSSRTPSLSRKLSSRPSSVLRNAAAVGPTVRRMTTIPSPPTASFSTQSESPDSG